MGGRRASDILDEFTGLRDNSPGVPISRMIDVRHELTALIKSELYGGGDKTEGRAALTARQGLDEFFFHTQPRGATAAEHDVLKSAIILTTLAEQAILLSRPATLAVALKKVSRPRC